MISICSGFEDRRSAPTLQQVHHLSPASRTNISGVAVYFPKHCFQLTLQSTLPTLIIVLRSHCTHLHYCTSKNNTMGKKKVLVSYGVDIDAVSLSTQYAIEDSDNKAGRRLARVIWRGGLDK